GWWCSLNAEPSAAAAAAAILVAGRSSLTVAAAAAERGRSAPQRDHAVDRGRFWEIIDTSRQSAKGSQDAQFDALEEQLRALPAEEVASFDAHFTACMGGADCNEVYAAAAIIDGFRV